MIAKKINYLIFATLCFIWALIAVAFYQSVFDRVAPSVYSLASSTTVEASMGQEIDISYNVARIRSCDIKIERLLEGTMGEPTYNLSFDQKHTSENEVGKEVRVDTRFKIPYSIMPGIYNFYGRISNECNVMHKFFPIMIETPKILVKVK